MKHLLLKIKNIEVEEHWFDSFFIDSDTTLSASVERLELFDEVILKAIWLREVVDEMCETCRANVSMTADLFSISHTDLTVSIERNEHDSEDFRTEISWYSDSNVWEDDDLDEINEHWVDVFFIDSDTVFDALDERCEIFDEVIVSKILTHSNFCFDVAVKISDFCVVVCEADEADESMIADFFIISHTNLSEEILRSELSLSSFWIVNSWCSNSSVRENENIETEKHWFDSFFIDFDTIFDALDERCEFFDEVIASKIMTDFDICFDVAVKISDSCEVDETDESLKIDFSSSSHIDLSVLIERDELLMSFFACCSRTCSRSFFLKLKILSHRIQIIFDSLTFANATWTNLARKTSIHSFNDAEFNASCLSYQISKTKSQRQVSNNISKSDFRYRCWHCWRCCRNFASSLNCRSSHVKIESKISISWSVDVDFATSSAFNAFDLIRLAFLTALNLVFFAIFRAFDFCCSCCFCCSCWADEVDEAIKAKTIELSKISHACSSRNCKTNSYACWFRAAHEEYWRRCESQVS